MADSTYSAGSISLAAGGLAVTGALTAFLSQVKPGDTLIHGAAVAVVTAVPSNTALALEKPWPGPMLTDEAGYLILRTGMGWKSATEINARLVEIIAAIEAGRGFQPDATGTLADRTLNDAAPKGFIFWRTDVTPFELYVKASATPGDWAGPTSVQGPPGPGGTDGASVADVLAQLGITNITVSTDNPTGPAPDNALWLKVPL